MLPNGELECSGRIDNQVKLHGYRIELEEIDRAIDAVPGVLAGAAAVVAPSGDEQLLAGYYVSDDEVTQTQLRDWLSTRLPHYREPADTSDNLALLVGIGLVHLH